MLDGLRRGAAGGGHDVAGLVEVGAEEGRFPAADCFLWVRISFCFLFCWRWESSLTSASLV